MCQTWETLQFWHATLTTYNVRTLDGKDGMSTQFLEWSQGTTKLNSSNAELSHPKPLLPFAVNASTVFCAQESDVTIILDFCSLLYHPHPAPSTNQFHLPAVSCSFPVSTVIAAPAPVQVPVISPGSPPHTANPSPSVSPFNLFSNVVTTEVFLKHNSCPCLKPFYCPISWG